MVDDILPAEINAAFQYVFYCVAHLERADIYRKEGDYKNWFDELMISASWVSIKMSEDQLKELKTKEEKINSLFKEWGDYNKQFSDNADKIKAYRPLFLELDDLEIWIRRVGDKGGILMKQGYNLDDEEW